MGKFKKVMAVAISMLMVIGLAACGGAEAVTSENGNTSITPVSGYKAEASHNTGEVLVVTSDSDDKYSQKNTILVNGINDEGYPDVFTFYAYSDSPYQYRRDKDYSMDALRADINLFISKYPNIYKDPKNVTIGEYDYIRVSVVTNGEDSYCYFTVVNGKPCYVHVIGGDVLDIDSDEVMEMLGSIKFVVE